MNDNFTGVLLMATSFWIEKKSSAAHGNGRVQHEDGRMDRWMDGKAFERENDGIVRAWDAYNHMYDSTSG